tara:strand:- start:140 stop:805 length:666 start_codon:yes stop_codon:yes gene_type:complete
MGIVIFTDDDSKFMDGRYIMMMGQIDTPPTNKDITYILRSNKFKEKDVLEWLPLIKNRLVVCCDKPPKITKKSEEFVIIDDSLKIKGKRNHYSPINALLTWKDRKRVSAVFAQTPLPLANVFLLENDVDIGIWRKIAQTAMFLPEKYTRAIMVYGIQPAHKKTKFPKKKKVVYQYEQCRESDKHIQVIVENSITVSNRIKEQGGSVPKGMNKTKGLVNEWL